MKTRRQFVHSSMMGLAATWTLPSFLDATILGLDARAADSAIQTATGKDSPILVVLQMGGGNDGLSMVVPFADDAYYRSRSQIALARDSVLRLDDYAGLHPNLAGLKGLFDNGDAALIHGVGYPNPNRSHFRSMEIWHTASDADKNEHYGWIGRYFDSACQGQPPTAGVNIGSMPPQAFLSAKPMGISMASPNRYKLIEPGDIAVADARDGQMVPMMADGENIAGSRSGSSIESLGAANPANDGLSNLQYLERTALDAEVSSQDIQRIVSAHKSATPYPSSRLGEDLKLIAQLIAGGLPTRIYYANLGGFDTHANQKPAHDRLMKEFSEAVTAFVADLKEQGNFNRVLMMTFSEFGRRVSQNGSGGTDHGAAGPMFLFGGAAKAGLHGKHPSLTDLNNGDLKHGIDFRNVYATVLEKWLKVDSTPVLKRKFATMDLLKA
ncbi:MAG: DUF1501 domain-containing protein [Candidatus Methylacidiphilales bacterium]|nr:DUF1501 domain-containing protein [Candidatus Methylacidiphilales bacterium]